MKGVFASEKASARNSDNVERMLSEINPDYLRLAVLATVQTGCAVLFGATRDNGALVVTLLNGNERAKAYPTSTPELEQCLLDLGESCGIDLASLMPKPPKTR